MAYTPQSGKTAFKPGTKGTITAPMEMKNIGIDDKTQMVADARLGMVKDENLQPGDVVEYKQAGQGPDKGRIIFLKVISRAVSAPALDEPAPPVEKREPEMIVGQFITKSGTQITIKESDGINHIYPADLTLLQYLSQKDTKVHSNDFVTIRLVDGGSGKMVAKDIGPAEQPEGFRNAKEILAENLKSTQPAAPPAATTKKAEPEETMEQFNERMGKKLQEEARQTREKENAQGDARLKENAEAARELAKPVSTPAKTQQEQVTKEPEKCQQKEAVTVSAPEEPLVDNPPVAIAECPVELSVHLDCGSYSNFDLKGPALPIDQAIARIEADAMKSIDMMRRLMAAAKKGY